jgi:hypothetical protein
MAERSTFPIVNTCKHPKTTKLNLNITKEEGDGNKLPLPFSLEHHHKRKRKRVVAPSFSSQTQKRRPRHCLFLLMLRHREEGDDNLFFSNTKKTEHMKTTKKKFKTKEGAYLQTPALPFYPLAFAFLFQALSLAIFLFSNRRKKKTQRKKKCTEGRELTFKLLFYLLIFGSYFCSLVFDLSFQALSPGIFSSRRKEKKRKTQRKKNHREGKKLQSREGAYLSSLASAFGMKRSSCFLLFTFFNVELFTFLKPYVYFSSKLCATQIRELSPALEME